MKASYSSFRAVYEYLDEIGVIGPAANALMVLLVAGIIVLVGVRLFRGYRIRDGLSGGRTRRKVKSLRARGQLAGALTFADAIELTETGGIRKNALEDKMANCVVPIELIFQDDDHGLYYQFEMGEWTRDQVTSWLEVAKSLNLPDMTFVLEEVVAMYDVICNPYFDPESLHEGKTKQSMLWDRASVLRLYLEENNSISRLRSACEAHLRKHAPDLLPLPVR